MIKFKINLAYGVKYEEGEKNFTNQELTQNYLNHAVNSKNPDGLHGSMRRTYGRLQRKIDAAIDSEKDFVEIEDAEFDIIRKAVDEAKFPGSASKYVNVLEDEIERVKTLQEKAEKKTKN